MDTLIPRIRDCVYAYIQKEYDANESRVIELYDIYDNVNESRFYDRNFNFTPLIELLEEFGETDDEADDLQLELYHFIEK